MKQRQTIIRITTVPSSLKVLLRNQLKFMNKNFQVIGVSSPEKELQEVAVQEGIQTLPVSMTRAITPFRDLVSIYKLYRICKKHQPVIIHSHTPKAGLIGMVAGRLAGVPVRLHTVAGLPLMESSGFKRWILETVEKFIYGFAHQVYPNSSKLADFILKSKFCPESKIKVLGNGSSNGIDVDHFNLNPSIAEKSVQLRKQLGFIEEDFVFVYIGRMVKDKGITELIDAYTLLKQEFPAAKLLLVGPFEPHLDPIPSSTVTAIKSNPSIVHVDFQQDVRPYLGLSQALVFPSYREGFPNVPMQAGCMGLPSIVTDINGCNEIVQDGVNGIIVPAKKTEPLRLAMKKIMQDKDFYASMKAVARKSIVNRFGQQKLYEIILKEYQNKLKSNQSV
jgi:glycosyltransferase involved in cell wall biosynthesis